MKQRRITEIRTAHPARDGDGVAIRRIAGMGHAGMDPILMVDELRSERRADFGGGFPPHPHRGMQTLTYMKEGGIVHEDSQGNRGEIRGGGAQWMSAGRGIIHSEMPTADTDGFHGFQIWVNLPAADKLSAPRYRDVSREELALSRGSGFEATAIAGHWRLAGEGEEAIALHGPLEELEERAGVLDLSLQPGSILALDTPSTESAIGFVYQGTVVHQDSPVGSGRLLITDGGDRWQLQAGPDGAGILLLRGQPLREPVAHYGPFVMNTAGEIEQAIRDFRAGQFA
jgi:redox-sensitive bicupin YhaK (pirin superfamily)